MPVLKTPCTKCGAVLDFYWIGKDGICGGCRNPELVVVSQPVVKPDTGYNGWANYETWNVSLWIGNDEALYRLAKTCRSWPKPYATFVMALNGFYGGVGEAHKRTPDGVSWTAPELDIDALNQMIGEL